MALQQPLAEIGLRRGRVDGDRLLALFGGIYQRHRARGKNANTTITINARRMCTLAWHLLHDGCDFAPNPPKLTLSPVTPLKD